jgi:hypothetical protein
MVPTVRYTENPLTKAAIGEYYLYRTPTVVFVLMVLLGPYGTPHGRYRNALLLKIICFWFFFF